MHTQVEEIRRECAAKILRWRNRELIARMTNTHMNTISRFVKGEEVQVSTLIAIERAVTEVEKAKRSSYFCVTCED